MNHCWIVSDLRQEIDVREKPHSQPGSGTTTPTNPLSLESRLHGGNTNNNSDKLSSPSVVKQMESNGTVISNDQGNFITPNKKGRLSLVIYKTIVISIQHDLYSYINLFHFIIICCWSFVLTITLHLIHYNRILNISHCFIRPWNMNGYRLYIACLLKLTWEDNCINMINAFWLPDSELIIFCLLSRNIIPHLSYKCVKYSLTCMME